MKVNIKDDPLRIYSVKFLEELREKSRPQGSYDVEAFYDVAANKKML